MRTAAVTKEQRLAMSYVLPIRRSSPEPPPEEFIDYLTWLGHRVDLIVVDNSDPDVFAADAAAVGRVALHVPPDESHHCLQQKVGNVLTGFRLAVGDIVVIADDDVRWDDDALGRIPALLGEADALRPQNYFSPLPWHARLDTARILINRATSADFPGTLVVRREVLEETDGYDGNLLFENLELLRTVEACGATVVNAPDLFVRRLPPTTRHFFSQRVRQAYDDFALPVRMVTWLALAPGAAVLFRRRKRWHLLGLAAASIAVAEAGRRRAGGVRVFPASSSLLAPVWLCERAVCAWLALFTRLGAGGVRYNGVLVRRAAHSRRQLRRTVGRTPTAPMETPTRGTKPSVAGNDAVRQSPPPNERRARSDTEGAA